MDDHQAHLIATEALEKYLSDAVSEDADRMEDGEWIHENIVVLVTDALHDAGCNDEQVGRILKAHYP